MINRIKEKINERPFLAGFLTGGISTVIILTVVGMI